MAQLSEVLDLEHIESLRSALGNERLQRLLNRFLETADDATGKLLSAMDAGDKDAVLAEAHQLKGVARNLGVQAVGMVAQQIEEACRSDAFETALGFRASLAEAHDDSKNAVSAYLAQI